MKPFCFFSIHDTTLDPTYIVGIYDADMKYDIYSNRQVILTGIYYDENIIQMCHERQACYFFKSTDIMEFISVGRRFFVLLNMIS